MSDVLKCNECGQPIGEEDDPHGCDFCHKTLCNDCILYWRDDEIGDEGKSCSECASDEPQRKEVPRE